MFLPAGLNELFEMVRFERTDQVYDIWLDEKKILSEGVFFNGQIFDAYTFVADRIKDVDAFFSTIFNTFLRLKLL